MAEPIAVFFGAGISISIWPKEGTSLPRCTIQKSYKNAEGEYVNTSSYTATDLMALRGLCEYAISKMMEIQVSSNRSNRPQRSKPVNRDAYGADDDIPF